MQVPLLFFLLSPPLLPHPTVQRTNIFIYAPDQFGQAKGSVLPPPPRSSGEGRTEDLLLDICGVAVPGILPDFIPTANISVGVSVSSAPSRVDYRSGSKPVLVFVPRVASQKGCRSRSPGAQVCAVAEEARDGHSGAHRGSFLREGRTALQRAAKPFSSETRGRESRRPAEELEFCRR